MIDLPNGTQDRAYYFNKLIDGGKNNRCKNLRSYVYRVFGKTLEKNQYKAIRDMLDPKIRNIYFSTARQAGKTESIAVFQALAAIFAEFVIPNYEGKGNCYVFAPKQEQAQISFERFSNLIHFNKADIFNGECFLLDRADRIKFSNGFEVRAITASRNAEIEGLTTHIIILDECVVSSCSVYTYEQGRYKKRTIKYVVDNKLSCEVLSFDEVGSAKKYKKVTNYFKKNLRSKKLYKIKVKSGKDIKEIECTGEHKIMTDLGMVKAKNLTKEHRIQIK